MVYEAASEAAINSLAATFEAQRRRYSISSTGTKWRIEAEAIGGVSDPGTELDPIMDRWEMPANEIQKSQWQHPKLLGFSADLLKFAQDNIDAGTKQADFLTAVEDAGYTLSTAEENLLLAFYDLVQRGSTHFATSQYVLKHTTTVAPAYAKNVADVNVERLYTTAQLLQECRSSILWAYPLPARLVYKIEHIAAPTAQSGYLWSWRKLPSAEATAAGGRIEISTEYWLEQWSLADYDLAV